jgi:hypothetical protein
VEGHLHLKAQAAAMCDELRAAYLKDVTVPRPGRKTVRTFEEVASSIGWIRPMQAIFDANPRVGYVAAAMLRRALTVKEAQTVAESTEAEGQGLLPNAEPAQTDLFVNTHVRVTDSDAQGEAFAAEVKRAVRMAQAVAQMEKATLYVRFVPNVVIRGMKGAGKAALRQQYGGRVYLSDVAEHNGTLLAIVTPNAGERTALGKVEWQVPAF